MTTLLKSVEFLSRIIDKRYGLLGSRPLIVGVSGPQGSGKTYLTEKVTDILSEKYKELNIVLLLMDDFYLTHEDQLEVTRSAESDDNELLQGRGLPGTHDLKLGLKVLSQLINREAPVAIPRYNKALFNGEGDREPDKTKWKIQNTPVDVVLFEGWFNGFKSISDNQLRLKYLTADYSSVLKRYKLYHLLQINQNLILYEKIWCLFEVFIFIQTDSVENVNKWRIEQEHCLIEKSGAGMSDSEVLHFVQRYLPVYELYYDQMCDHGLEGKTNLKLEINEKRNLLDFSIL